MRGRAEGFYAALAALLFAAACAWLGAALYAALVPAEAPDAGESPSGGRLRGILLRHELLLAEAIPGAAEGERLSAAETGTEPGLFFSGTDGYEFLSPEDARPLSPEALDRLLALPPEKSGGAKLVTGWDCCCAALLVSGEPPAPGARCRVRLDGADRAYEAAVLAVDENAVLLRFTEGLELLCRLRFVEGEILP